MTNGKVMRLGRQGWYGPLVRAARATLSVEAELYCEVCGESKLLTASVDAFDPARKRAEYGDDVEHAIVDALAKAAARFDYQVVHVAPTERTDSGNQECVSVCPPCRERIKRALLTALRRA